MDILSLKEALHQVRNNPTAIHQLSLDMIAEVRNDLIETIPSNSPVATLLYASAINATMAVEHCETLTRQIYPALVDSLEDLYRHMSDEDHIDRFAVPGSTTITMLVPKSEIVDKAVVAEDGTYRKIVMPRDTNFRVAGYDFGIYYPIEFRTTGHDAIQIAYDTTIANPLKTITITNNRLQWTNHYNDGVEYLRIEIPVYQFTTTTETFPVKSTSGFIQLISYDNQYYHTRVYSKISDLWVEMATSHSDQIYDLKTPTAIIQVHEEAINVRVPQIYLTNSLVGDEIRIDIYTTCGEITLDLTNYTADQYQAEWRDIGNETLKVYISAITQLNNMVFISNRTVTGGSSSVDFETMRDRIISNRVRKKTPTTSDELEVYLADRGYGLIKSVDNITDRVYIATRHLPTPPSGGTIVGAASEVVKLNDGVLIEDEVPHQSLRLVLGPDNLYIQEHGKITRLSKSEQAKIYSSDNDTLVETLEKQKILYSPYHYVLDYNDLVFSAMPYYLTSPTVQYHGLIAENLSYGYQLGTEAVMVTYVAEGWEIIIQLREDATVQEIPTDLLFVQLSYIPDGESRRVYLNGTPVTTISGRKMFRFMLLSTFNIDRDHNIALSGFSMYKDDLRDHRTPLETDFHLTYCLGASLVLENIQYIDAIQESMGTHLLPNEARGVSLESLQLVLGKTLASLTTRSRSTVSTEEYQKWEMDVPAMYNSTTLERDEEGNLILIDNPDGDGKVPVIVHSAGDPVVIDGEPVYAFREGDNKLDSNGQPIPVEGRGMNRYVEMLLIDGRYKFTTEPTQVEYRDALPRYIVDYLEQDIDEITPLMLERTELFFAPRRTFGTLQIRTDDDTTLVVNSEQGISVIYYVSEDTMQDEALLETIRTGTREEINLWLNSTTLSLATLTQSLLTLGGRDIIGVFPEWNDELSEINTLTLVDSSTGITISQEIKQTYDNLLQIEDDVDIRFILHQQ